MKVVAVVCARMGSTRLPGKALLPIGGRPMLLRVIDRLSLCERLDSIVVATTARPENKVIQKVCEREGIGCVVFPTLDDAMVVARLGFAAMRTSADAILRVTPDCPLVDAAVVDSVIAAAGAWFDYSSNCFPRSFPDGLDCEYVTLETLNTLPEAEDATRYIWEHPEQFRIASVANHEDLSALNWTVNHAADLQFVRWVYERLPEGFGWQEVLSLLGEDHHGQYYRRLTLTGLPP